MTNELKHDLSNFGYADGGYIGKCSHCKASFTGDKRAWSCKSCAEKKALEPKTIRATPSTDPLAGLMRWKHCEYPNQHKMMEHKDGEYILHSEAIAIIEKAQKLADELAELAFTIHPETEASVTWKEMHQGAKTRGDHWKANHDNMAQRNAVLSQRPDLPVDRLPAIREYERMLAVKDAEIEKAKKEINALLVSFVREHFPDNKAFQPLDNLLGEISQLDNAITITREFKKRAEAAEAKLGYLEAFEKDLCAMLGVKNDDEALRSVEALLVKLAQIKAQEPVFYQRGYRDCFGNQQYRLTVSRIRSENDRPLYAAPVSDSLKAENYRLREALTVASMSAGFQYMTFETRALIDAALNVKTSA